MSLGRKIYDNSPIFLQNIMITLSGYYRNRSRYGKNYYRHLEFLKDFDAWTIEEKLEYQKSELIKFINYAYKNSKFYNKLYQEIDISSIKTISDLQKLPIIDKELIRTNIKDVSTISKKNGIEGHTGGTTGKSLVVLFTKEDRMKRMAMLDHFKVRVGFIHRKMRRATFNGKHIVPPKQTRKVFWRYNRACKQMIYSSFHLSEDNMIYYVNSLNKFKPHAIDGFFTCMVDLANYIERNHIELTFKPIAIFPTSETLTEAGRLLLERVFKCKVYDQYASSEGAPFVTECPDQKLHIELSTGIFEYLSSDSDEILVTSFTTHGTPLIRYRIGDAMKFDNTSSCNCNINSPKVKEIQGRRLEFLYTTAGAKINAGNVSNLFKNIPNSLVRAQVIQEKVDEIKVLLEVDKNLYKPKYDDLLKEEFKYKFGNDMNVIIEHVEEIVREKSGKFRLIINKIREENEKII